VEDAAPRDIRLWKIKTYPSRKNNPCRMNTYEVPDKSPLESTLAEKSGVVRYRL
jgi:hypothetical protein